MNNNNNQRTDFDESIWKKQNLRFGFAANIKLLDAQRKNTRNPAAETPRDTVATGFKDIVVLAEAFLDGHAWLVHLS